jgi:hypothetical protein
MIGRAVKAPVGGSAGSTSAGSLGSTGVQGSMLVR